MHLYFLKEDLNAVGFENLSNTPVPCHLPPGTYDVGDGIYDPKTYRIMKPVGSPLIRLSKVSVDSEEAEK